MDALSLKKTRMKANGFRTRAMKIFRVQDQISVYQDIVVKLKNFHGEKKFHLQLLSWIIFCIT